VEGFSALLDLVFLVGTVFLVLTGALVTFFGRRMMKLVIVFYGALLGFLAGAMASPGVFLGLGLAIDPIGLTEAVPIVFGTILLFTILGAKAAWGMYRAGIALLGGFAGVMIGGLLIHWLGLPFEGALALVPVVILIIALCGGAVLALRLEEKYSIWVTSASGSLQATGTLMLASALKGGFFAPLLFPPRLTWAYAPGSVHSISIHSWD